MTCPSTAYIHATRVPPTMTSAREAIRWINWDVDSLSNTVNSALDNQALLNAQLRSSVNSLVNTANQYQENFVVIVNEIRSILRRIENLES